MAAKPKAKPKLTDADRHNRFKDMACEVEASNDPKDFDKAFKKVPNPSQPRRDSHVSRHL